MYRRFDKYTKSYISFHLQQQLVKKTALSAAKYQEKSYFCITGIKSGLSLLYNLLIFML